MIYLSLSFLILGVLFIVLSVAGLLKMKDLLLRLQVASKASTLGLMFCLVAVILQKPDAEIIIKAVLTMLFIFLTTPVAAQAIAKLGHTKRQKDFHLATDDLSEDIKEGRAV